MKLLDQETLFHARTVANSEKRRVKLLSLYSVLFVDSGVQVDEPKSILSSRLLPAISSVCAVFGKLR